MRLANSLTISEGGADQALSGRDNQICLLVYGPPAAPLHEPNSAQLSQHLQLAVASVAASNDAVPAIRLKKKGRLAS